MLFLILFAFLFFWLIIREVRQVSRAGRGYDSYSKGYIAVLVLLVLASLWYPVKYWRFERFLEKKAIEYAEGRHVTLKCNSAIESIFDPNVHGIGYARPETGEIVLQFGWCKGLMGYLDDPESPSMDELMSLEVFNHEVMHIRGELNEQRTECQAIQRYHRASMLLGVPEVYAVRNVRRYYREIYPRHPYFSPDCVPGGPMDEELPDAVWDDE